MKTKRYLKVNIIVCFLFIAGCADWNSTPVKVDEQFGMAVRDMVAKQTLYPEHGQTFRQDLLIDGIKSEGAVRAYRAPTTDLRRGKRNVNFGIDSQRSRSE